MRRQALAALIGVALTLTPGFAPAQTYREFHGLVVFGDSLSDNGNFFRATGQPPAPYFQGRFSNGLVWVEQLASSLRLDGSVNHAVAGATTSDVFSQQVMPYLTARGGVARSDLLYVVWAGANDLLPVLQTPGTNPTPIIQNAMAQTAASVGALVTAGARFIMVPNLADLGGTPRALAAGPAAAAGARQLTMAYNSALAGTIATLQALLDRRIMALDVFGLMDEVVANPGLFGLINVSQPAFSASAGTIVASPNSYLFWDDIHPTTAGHGILRDRALRLVVRSARVVRSRRVGRW